MTSPIEDFEAELRHRLGRSDSDGPTDIADEVGDHLREIRQELIAEGVPWEQAERLAVARFGSVDTVAGTYRSDWLPARYEVAIIGAVLMCWYGIAGVIGSLIGNTFGGTTFIDEPSSATRAHVLVHVLVGCLGIGLAESLWLRRDGRRLQPGSPVARVGMVILVVVAGLYMAATFSSMIHGDSGICPRWLTLAGTSELAIGAYAFVYRREVAGTALPPPVMSTATAA